MSESQACMPCCLHQVAELRSCLRLSCGEQLLLCRQPGTALVMPHLPHEVQPLYAVTHVGCLLQTAWEKMQAEQQELDAWRQQTPIDPAKVHQ